ncbi:MAG: hypothetical protein COB60_05795 [Flavobacteriaceae bacterium]|nr:MAG: hypothetical protein COB60_05795 [Flavobacteriaceae bacterium]
MKKLLRHKVFFQYILLLAFISCNLEIRKEKADVVLPIIPQPNDIRVFEGSFTLDSSTHVVLSTKEQNKVAIWFTKELQKLYGLSCHIGTSPEEKNTIVLTQDDSFEEEAYLLEINDTKVSIKASSEAGYFYAFQTILQLAPVSEEKVVLSKLEIAQVTIADQPRFKWRGVMLDISRHFFGQAPIKKLIDQMAAQKMNRLHLHLTDDSGWRIEIKEYPNLHKIGSRGDRSNPKGPALYLTEEEARDIAAYASERQIEIIPEIDMPGHMGALERAYPAFYGGNNTLNIANEDAIKMVKTVILRVAEIFNTRYVHFGSDEVRKHNWDGRADMRARMNELGINNQHEFEGWFDREMADFIVESGLNPVAWDEASDFGVNKNTIVQWWRCLQPDALDSAVMRGYNVIISPADFVYFDYPYNLKEAGANWEGLRNGANSTELIYKWNPIPKTFNKAMEINVIGIEAAVWTEFVTNQKRLEYMIYPRLSAMAEKAWTHDVKMDWEAFQKRLSKQYVRYKMAGINYRIPNIGIEERKIRQPEAFEGPITK